MDTWIDVAGWTLVHFVWQGAAIAAGAAVGLYLLRQATPNVRYVFASAALILMPLSLAATAFLVSSPAAASITAPTSPSSSILAVLTSTTVRIDSQNRDVRAHQTGSENALGRLSRAFPVIVITWLAGVAILLVRLATGWWHVRRLQRVALTAPASRWQAAADRLARRLGIRRRVCVTDADTIETPTVIGWWRPVIVLPLSALSGLTPSQTDAILVHELAHIRRHDYLVNLLQHVTETVLFYHPAVWWLSRRMRVEREQCCDAIVVQLCADPLDYATALTRLEEARQPDTRLAVAATGGTLIERVRRLLGARTDRHMPITHAIVTAAITALVVVVVGGGYRWSNRMLHAASPTEQRVETATRPAAFEPVKQTNVHRVSEVVPTKASVSVHADAAVPHESAQERRLENAPAGNAGADMSIAVEVNYFQMNRAEYSVPVSVRIPGSELALARTRGADRTTIDLNGEIKDAYGIPVQNLQDALEIKLSDDSVEQLAKRLVQYDAMFMLLPGKYDIKIQTRDAETGRAGTFQSSFTIPNLNRETSQVPISTVVLGSQLVRLNEDAKKNNANPLVFDGLKLVPSVTRVFSKAQNMYVFLQAYEPDATTARPVVAFVTLYRGAAKAFETAPLRVVGVEGRANAVPLRFSVPLADLAPGRYDCEVTVQDPDGQKVSSWRAPVDLVP